jgi:pimeloyl-ACP methyl ester carboxylesterase
MLNRRRLLQGTAALALSSVGRSAFAQDEPPVPIVFVQGDSDLAATWETQIWRFESNGYPRDRLFAISFTDPQARDDDTVARANRSSTADQLRELTAFIEDVKAKTGASKVAIVASSRGGYAAREYVAANPGSVSHAVLGGTPNHGVWATDFSPGSEYNGRGPFLTKLDAGDAEVTPGVPFMTLRSDGFDLYAQPDGGIVFHKPGMALNVTADGPALKGATNVLLGQVDHRDTALSPVAFAEIYRFITGREPSRIAIAPEADVVLNGRVTGVVAGTPTNRPVEGAKVDIYRVPETLLRFPCNADRLARSAAYVALEGARGGGTRSTVSRAPSRFMARSRGPAYGRKDHQGPPLTGNRQSERGPAAHTAPH